MNAPVAERQQALDARFPEWSGFTLHGALDRAVRDFSGQPYVITDERTWSYADVAAASHRLAQSLLGLGIGGGDKVALIMANYPEFVIAKYAISRVGAVAVPINMLNRKDELEYLLRQSDSSALITMDQFRGNDYLGALDQLAPGWEAHGGGEALPCLKRVIIHPTGEVDERAGTLKLADLINAGDGSGDLPSVAPGDLCDIIYTSGTTGSPKGVMLTHDMLTRTAFGSAYARAFEPGRRIVFALPMYHVFGYGEGMLAVLWVGGAIIPHLRFDAGETLAAIERHRASDALWIPAMSLAVLDAFREQPQDVSSLTSVLASGARAPERVWQALRDELGIAEITTGYGMTETTASTTVTRPDDPMERLLTTNGRMRDVGAAGASGPNGKLVLYRVIDPESGTVLPEGEVGELVARGPGVTAGYYNKPEATATAFDSDGWLRTGDLARIDGDGYVTLAGRTKESYRCGGELVLPTEVEDLLTSQPEVLVAQVVPIPDERMGEVGVAFVVASPGATVDVEALRRLITDRVARFKVPRHFLVVSESEIPTTASGRARKFLLSRLALEKLELQ
jgi:fatty-acyl-CoA synthase